MKYVAIFALILFTLCSRTTGATTGKVVFTGKLIEKGCDFGIAGRALNSECYRNGQWKRHSQPLTDINETNKVERVHTQLIWFDKQQQKGLVIVSYY
jgi:type 1 fimbria pilin